MKFMLAGYVYYFSVAILLFSSSVNDKIHAIFFQRFIFTSLILKPFEYLKKAFYPSLSIDYCNFFYQKLVTTGY